MALLVTTVIYAAWWFQPQHIAPNSGAVAINVAYFGVLSVVVWRGLVHNLFLLWLVGGMRRPMARVAESGARVAMITCFVPGKEPLATLEASVRAMLAVSYPHDTWVLDEGNSPEVLELCQELGVSHFSRRGVPDYNTVDGPFKVRNKGGNHNAWYDRCTEAGIEYDYVCQLDVDFVCHPDILEATLGYFRDPKVASVVTPQVYGNTRESIIARGASQHTLPFYGALQMALYGRDGFAFMIGAVYAGLAGCLYASSIRFVSPDSFSGVQAVLLMTMLIVGGMGSIAGCIVGALALTILPEVLRFLGQWYLVLYGLGVIVVIVLLPGGLASMTTGLSFRRAAAR